MSVFREKSIYIIFANTICGIMGVSLIVPDLPEIGRAFHLTPHQIGMVLTLITLPGTVLVLFLGVLADRMGRKALMVPSLVLFSISGGAIYWADSFATLGVLRFVQGIGATILPTISIMLIGDHFHGKERLKVMGLNGAVLSFGTAFFPFLGGMMATQGWRVPFLGFFAVLPVALWIALAYREPEKHSPNTHITGYLISSALHMSKKGILLAYSMGLVIFVLLYGGVLTYLTLDMDHRFGMGTFEIGLYIGSASFASAFFAPFAHKLEGKIGRRGMFGTGFALFATSFFCIDAIVQKEWLIAAICLFGAAMGLTIPLMQNVVTELAPVEYRGIMTAMLAMLTRLGQTLGPPLLAIFITGADFSAAFFACGLLAAAVAAVVIFRGTILEQKNGSNAV